MHIKFTDLSDNSVTWSVKQLTITHIQIMLAKLGIARNEDVYKIT